MYHHPAPAYCPYLIVLSEIFLHRAVKQQLCFIQSLLYDNFLLISFSVPYRKSVCNRGAIKAPKNTQPDGAATPEGQRRASCASLSLRLSAFFESTSRPRSQSGKVRRSDTRPGDVCERAERAEGSDTTPIRNAPVSPCEPLCAILLRKPSVYPISGVKANVGRLCEKLENAMKAIWNSVVAVTFWRYLRKCLLEKSRTLQGDFSGGEGRSILAQDKGPQSQAPAARPQSPAVRGFPRF